MHRRVLNPRRITAFVLLFLTLRVGMAAAPTRAGGETGTRPSTLAAAAAEVSAAAEVASTAAAPVVASGVPAAPAPLHVDGSVIPQERIALVPILVQAAQEYGLPTDLMLAQAWAESSWRVDAVSYAQAAGVLQLTPATVDFVSHRLLKLDHKLDPFDPLANARMGARYMQHLLNRTAGDLRQALIAYNQGLTALLRNGPYAEAVAYADRVLALRPQFA